ncbi:SNF2 family helicase/ATPase-like protein [Massariosphaeria phaeospora]|uniref:SNF2 family helicase/ATPase-like protein n=1 Tax=Massariosphaeria phaeospora TaxID=100035 RepID=A0A7C8IE64_9PLEO|nr:SNF2 family helicase/ATPase-like protein [Massariosphaeria phaeospora]
MSKRPASEGEADRGREDPIFPGQVSLVERLHNVHERTASPAKRIKTEAEGARQLPPSAIGSSGALDLQSNNNRATSSTNNQPTSTPAATHGAIDLTMDDDDEPQVMQDNGMQIICIGRVKQAYIQSHTVPNPDPKKYRGNHGSQGRIKVSFRRGGVQRDTQIILVVDPTGKEFGRVDLKTAQGLAPLMDAARTSGLMWLAWTEQRRKQPNEAGPGTPLNTLIGLTLQLYCPRKVARDVGRFLKVKAIDLVNPVLDLQRHDYFNPHTMDSFQASEAGASTFDAIPPHGRPTVFNNYVLRSIEEIRFDVQNMFDTYINTSNLPERTQNPIIGTQLMEHQQQALHFMWDREQDWSGAENDSRKDSLFQPKHPAHGPKFYVNVITGEKVNVKPGNARGGILADEMGLGKTLSVLSLIADAESLECAKEFSRKSHRIYNPVRISTVTNSRATLLICPLSTMINWKQQVEEHFPASARLKWTMYHGANRKSLTAEILADHDLVITTYGMIASDYKDKSKPLSYVHWFRIVLDEAHSIRSSHTQQHIAACSLAAQRRWAVTGTPVQNKLDDLGALFKFLRISPFDTTAGFSQYILNPFKNADPEVVPKLQLLVSSLTLRRLKEGVLDLPPRHDIIVRLEFSKDERKLHDWFEKDSERKVNAVTAGEKLGGNSYARILTCIMNLRLICAHGRDLLSDEALKLTDGMTADNPVEVDEDGEPNVAPALTRTQAYEMLELLEQTSTDKCQYCQRNIIHSDSEDVNEDDNSVAGFMTSCYHLVCPSHVKRLRSEWAAIETPDGLITCQFCDSRVRPDVFTINHEDFIAFQDEREALKKDPKMAKKIGSYTGPHTKTKALLHDLGSDREWSVANPDERPIKSVIFSTWTTHLDLIQIALKDQGHTWTRLDGRMSRQARDKALHAFAHDDSVHNILVSIGAGGLGLNLTTANKVYVMEPQFNPAAEAQAVDRVHRLGQTREVTIKRFVMDNSFEEKMLELQRKKKALADLTMSREKGATKEQAAKKRLEDLRCLFK